MSGRSASSKSASGSHSTPASTHGSGGFSGGYFASEEAAHGNSSGDAEVSMLVRMSLCFLGEHGILWVCFYLCSSVHFTTHVVCYPFNHSLFEFLKNSYSCLLLKCFLCTEVHSHNRFHSCYFLNGWFLIVVNRSSGRSFGPSFAGRDHDGFERPFSAESPHWSPWDPSHRDGRRGWILGALQHS